MKLIGESLLITTERWAYTIAGNNESNYRLVRVSTRMAGVGDYQMDEFISDVEGTTTIVVFVGTDAKIYAMPLGGQAVWISKEIQTYLATSTSWLFVRARYQKVRVHCMTTSGRRMVLVYIPDYSGNSGKTFFYDFDQKIWTEETITNANSTAKSGADTAWATVPSPDKNSIEIYTTRSTDTIPPISPVPIIDCREWFDVSYAIPVPGGYVRTFPLTFDGKKTRKQLHFIRIYVNDQSSTSVDPGTGATKYPWRCTVQVDSAAAGTPMTFSDPLDTVYNTLSGGFPVDASTAAERIITGVMLTGGPPMIGYTFDVTVYFPTQTNKVYQLYRMDIGWSTVSEVDP